MLLAIRNINTNELISKDILDIPMNVLKIIEKDEQFFVKVNDNYLVDIPCNSIEDAEDCLKSIISVRNEYEAEAKENN